MESYEGGLQNGCSNRHEDREDAEDESDLGL
jgi:hypothetical protein